MAARGTITVKDRTPTTPVDHAFTPDGDDANQVHLFSEKTGVPIGNPRLTAALRRSKGKHRMTLRLAVPQTQLQTVNGVTNPVVVRTAYVELHCTFDGGSSVQERADAVGLMANAMAPSQTIVNDLLVNAVDIW